MKSAFTLLELCIVFVIIGLLIGGIMAGRTLIHAAEMQDVIQTTRNYTTAILSFKQKYNGLPGDITNATQLWGSAGGPLHTNDYDCWIVSSSGPATCDGNGDGKVADISNEMFRFWQQLANAGMITGSYTGTAISDGVTPNSDVLGSVPGVNVPKGKIDNTGYSFSYINYMGGDAGTYGMNYGNSIWFGAKSGHRTQQGAFTPEDAWSIDSKLDDGSPALGKYIARSDPDGFGQAKSCTTSANQLDFTGEYRLGNHTISCAFMIETKL